jgi:hypothetical protein
MRRIWGLMMIALVLSLVAGARAADAKAKGTLVDLDGYTSTTPPSWKKVKKPSSKLRFLEFELPKAKEDKIDGEVALFKNAGGTLKENIARWRNQFVAPKGKTIEDVTKITDIKIGGKKATMVDIQGTFQPPPFVPKFGGKKWPKFRRIAIQFQGPDSLYHIILTGPADTVAKYKDGLDKWLKEFKK